VTTPPGVGLTPYVTPAVLTQAPTGISWNTIPSGSQITPQQRTAEQWNICSRATSIADGYCNQILRATPAVEYASGPDYYTTIQQDTGNIRIILSQWPVLSISSIMVSPNTFPRTWTSVPTGYWQAEQPVVSVYGTSAPPGSAQGGQAIIVSSSAGGGWWLGRNGFVFAITYFSGWPHTGLTSAVAAGAETLAVDDCSAWVITDPLGVTVGARGVIYDPGGAEEIVNVTASSATSGPGNLTLAQATQFTHPQYTMVSAMPQTIQWACILYATSIALTRGATATTVHTMPGGAPGEAGKGPEALAQEAELLLHSYRRVI
jgi:hypothetical protein